LPANGAYLQPGLGVVAFWFDAGGAGEGGENPGIVIPKF